MSQLFFLQRLFKPVGKLASASGRSLIRAKPFLVALSAIGSTYYLTTAYVYDVCYSLGPSMEATIPDRPNLLGVDKRYRKGRGIQVGDCVQIASPQQPGILAGKRVIGLPGDYILRSKNGSATPGGAPMPGVTDWRKRYGIDSDKDDDEWEEPELIQVPEGHIWVEGDNLAWSRDSRLYGPVPMALIKGRSSWFSDGLFSWNSLHPGEGLRKVEEWEKSAVLGDKELKSGPRR